MTVLEQLKINLPEFTWTQENKDASIFGVITAPQVTKRINKDLYKLNNVYVFISSKMGGTPDNPTFRYAMCYQKGEMRPYRHKNTTGVEYKKLFVSDKNLKGIAKKLIEQIDLKNYFLPNLYL